MTLRLEGSMAIELRPTKFMQAKNKKDFSPVAKLDISLGLQLEKEKPFDKLLRVKPFLRAVCRRPKLVRRLVRSRIHKFVWQLVSNAHLAMRSTSERRRVARRRTGIARQRPVA